jgi:xanthine dehydrogenase accessory factor
VTVDLQQAGGVAAEPGTISAGERRIDPVENVLPYLLDWQRRGLRTALVTLVAIDGSFPRALGAQMAIAEDGSAAGYISGGCLESALIAEAQDAMAERKNRLVRYGKGSKYFDIVLPCGSGVDVYFDINLPTRLTERILAELISRRPALLQTSLANGRSVLVASEDEEPLITERRENVFARAYQPRLKLVIAGMGPAVSLLARLASTAEMDVEILTPEAGLIEEAARRGFSARTLTLGGAQPALTLDTWTAVALLFHDHGWEQPLLPVFLKSECFYIGAVGSSGTRQARQRALAEMGLDPAAMTTLRTPAGMIPHAKQPAELAVSILADIVAAAKDMRAHSSS